MARRWRCWGSFFTIDMVMDNDDRMRRNAETALQGERERVIGGVAVRPVSVESLSVLEMIGSPLVASIGAAVNGEPDPYGGADGRMQPGRVQMVDVLVFAWVHVADQDEVLRVALGCRSGLSDLAVEAALRWSRGVSMAEINAACNSMLQDVEALKAAAFEPVDSPGKKNV